MTRPWTELDAVDTAEGRLCLLKRGEDDYLITVDGRVLMNAKANRTELALAEMACEALSARKAPRVLIGGLGMGCTLRAALDALPEDAAVQVDELTPVVVDWCRGPLAELNGAAVDDPRVRVELCDVSRSIRRAAEAKDQAKKYDAIILDLYQGPTESDPEANTPFFSDEAVRRSHLALKPGGIFAVWGEEADPAFDKRLRACGFSGRSTRPKSGAKRHRVWIANKT